MSSRLSSSVKSLLACRVKVGVSATVCMGYSYNPLGEFRQGVEGIETGDFDRPAAWRRTFGFVRLCDPLRGPSRGAYQHVGVARQVGAPPSEIAPV